MDGYPTKAMICALPILAEWCQKDLPHMTLAYLGDIADYPESAKHDFALLTSDIAVLQKRPFRLRVQDVEVFGEGTVENPNVDVFRLRFSSTLMAMRNRVAQYDKSKHPFTPHVTIGPEGSRPTIRPPWIAFDRLALSWGDSVLEFRL